MIRRDMPEVLKIDKDSHNPWDEETFMGHLRQRNCIGLVCEIEEKNNRICDILFRKASNVTYQNGGRQRTQKKESGDINNR